MKPSPGADPGYSLGSYQFYISCDDEWPVHVKIMPPFVSGEHHTNGDTDRCRWSPLSTPSAQDFSRQSENTSPRPAKAALACYVVVR